MSIFPSMKRLLHFLDEHILSLVSAFLLVFIPVYPKLPLFDIIPGYIVRVRLEDMLIVVAIGIYVVQILRGKAFFWKTPLTKPILLYITVGFLSVLSALFITQTVPLQPVHVQKLLLHFLRRIEYFSLFFIFFSSIRSLRQVKLYFLFFSLAVVSITLYGYGQKYLYWCAFSTMNREFSKGWCLYLTEHARVISTFGGHYDLAAFTMLALSFFWSLVFGLREKMHKLISFIILAGSFWLIILTASRISFIAYILALTIVVFLWTFKRGIGWGISRWLVTVGLSILVMLSFGDLSERFQRIFRINERFGGLRALLLRPAVAPPTGVMPLTVEDQLAQVTSKSDQPPSLYKPGTTSFGTNTKPADVNEEVPEWVSTERLADGTLREVPKRRSYSKNALRFDLSTSIRLDALWPRAWQGFLQNPLLGSGYSTLTKVRISDFTEAESTDNGYLRALGETGILGSIAFFAIIFTIISMLFRALGGVRDPVFYALIAGGIGGIFGLLINAAYIDIFEASKIALPFWSLSGILLGGIVSEKDSIERHRQVLRISLNWSRFFYLVKNTLKSETFWLLVIVVGAFNMRLYKLNAPVADWHSWRQADTSAVSRNFDRFGINLLYPIYDDLSSVASGKPNPHGYRMVEFPIYNALSVLVKRVIPEFTIEVAGRFTSILASLGSLVFLYLLTRKYLGIRVAYLASIVFAIDPYNIFYSRSILPEPMLVFSSLGMLYFFDRWLEKIRIHSRTNIYTLPWYVLALISSSTALLLKPYAAFLFLPLLYLIWENIGWKGFLRPGIFGFFVLAIVPLSLWRMWITQFPEGIPAYTWLLNGDGIRFKGAFFFWIFADRLARLILGYWGLIPLAIGCSIRSTNHNRTWLFHVWLGSMIIYLVTFATGNVRHDYYQIITVPIVSVFVALGLDLLLFSPPPKFYPLASRLIGVLAFIFMVIFGWYHIRDFFNINHEEIVLAGKAVEAVTHWKAKVIAPYNGDTAFLYHTQRYGWPIIDGTIDQLIEKGAQYYVSVNFDEVTKSLLAYTKKPDMHHPYKLIKEDPQFVIIQLVPDAKLPKD